MGRSEGWVENDEASDFWARSCLGLPTGPRPPLLIELERIDVLSSLSPNDVTEIRCALRYWRLHGQSEPKKGRPTKLEVLLKRCSYSREEVV